MSARAIIVMILATALTGCMFKKPAPAPPPAAIPAAVPVPAPAPPPTPPVDPIPIPILDLPTPSVPSAPIDMPQPTAPKPVVVRRRRPAPKPPASKPVTVVPPAPSAPAPAPQLGEILTPAQQIELSRAVDQSTLAARAALTRMRARNLTSDQSETAARIKTFADQADQARKTDLRAAVQLARRAEVLARDLESSIK